MLYILHQVNCCNAFGAGFAGYLAEHAPQVKKDYHNFCKNFNGNLLGNWCASKYDDKVTVIHIFSQYNYGNSRKTNICYTDYQALNYALESFRTNHPNDIAICPQYIGCGLAGGNWNIVSKILAQHNITPCDKIDLDNRVYHTVRS